MTTEPSYTAFMLYRMIDPHVYETNRSVLRKVYKRIKWNASAETSVMFARLCIKAFWNVISARWIW